MRDRLIYFVYFGVILICGILFACDSQAMGGREYYYTKVYPLEYKAEKVSLSVLSDVNKTVNGRIVFRRDKTDEWKINPSVGDCEDFALSKLVTLNGRGIPLSAMRLGKGRAWGEKHMVLLVKTSRGEIVLDNLTTEVYENKGQFTPIMRKRVDDKHS